MGEGRESVGERIYLIREALGTRRDPLPLDKFAELIAERTGVTYDKSVLSRMETGDRKVSLDDIAALAAVDPERRGRTWLAWGNPGDEGEQGAKPVNGNPRPRHPIVETKVQYLDPRVPTQPNRAKPKDAPKKPGRSAVA